MKILSLNCQKGFQASFGDFFRQTISSETYDFLLLQEASSEVSDIVAAYPQYVFERLGSVAIVYRKIFALVEMKHLTFSSYLGLLVGIFLIDGQKIAVGSVHLHSGLQRSVRRSEAGEISKFISLFTKQCAAVIVSGDFNLGPGELANICRSFEPEFKNITARIGTTLDSRYTENAPHLTNKIARVLAWVGISIRLKTDHVFVSEGSFSRWAISCRAVDVRVSDHCPIEISFLDRKDHIS